VIITNPSSNIVQYSVELTSTYENRKIKNQIDSPVFEIATVDRTTSNLFPMKLINLVSCRHSNELKS